MGNFSTSFQAAYTPSHSIGNVDLDVNDSTIEAEATTDQSNPGLDKGNTNINRPNIFVANEVLFLLEAGKPRRIRKEYSVHGRLIALLASMKAVPHYFTPPVLQVVAQTITPMARARQTAPATCPLLWAPGYTGNNRPLVTDTSCNTSRNGDQILNPDHFTLVGYTLGTFPSNLERRGPAAAHPIRTWTPNWPRTGP